MLFVPISDNFWLVNLVEREDQPKQEWSARGTNGRNGVV
jgi:hypothetical protein